MSPTPPLGRRAFLEALLAAAAWGLGAPALIGCGRARPLEGALAAFYADARSARAVGRAVLERHPEEGDPDTLLLQLAGSRLPRWERLAAADPVGLAEALREAHRADLREDRVVAIRGWVLSRSEARLCALAELLSREPG
jgi:hypothetical protein